MNKLIKTILLTATALIAFAANSVLCKMALGENAIDASSFTIIRLLSGAIVLAIVLKIRKNGTTITKKGSWFSSSMLFLYAITFSFAYISLDTGTGALIMFGAVQITMISISIINGNRLHLSEWIGVVIAFLGFVYLILPGVNAPSPTGFVLMLIAGSAWGIYSLNGKGSKNPIMDTAYNFIRTLPFLVVLLIFVFKNINYTNEGILLAVISGGLTSGIGYAIWYLALGGLSAVQAAVVQLFVPVIAAFGGVIFIYEKLTFRLGIASFMILGGILIVVIGRKYFRKQRFMK
jgi:drug/metabolite transporter (DMT)-like permease